MWVTPITNRDRVDVDYAKIDPHNPLPNRGALNYIDLNRIESNCEYLAGQLLIYGYSPGILIIRTDWAMADFPYRSEIDRVRGNVGALVDAYHKMTGSPDIRYWDSIDWTDANSLEKNLWNINQVLIWMISIFWHSNEYYAGEEEV